MAHVSEDHQVGWKLALGWGYREVVDLLGPLRAVSERIAILLRVLNKDSKNETKKVKKLKLNGLNYENFG